MVHRVAARRCPPGGLAACLPGLSLVLLLLVLLPGSGAARAVTEGAAAAGAATQAVTGLRLGRIPGRTRLVLDLDAPPDYRQLAGEGPAEVVLLLAEAHWQVPANESLLVGSPVLDLRHGDHGDGQLRLALRLREPRRVEIFPLKPYAGQGHRLVIDLYASGPDAGPAPAAADVEAERASPASVVRPPASAPTQSPVTAGGAGEEPGPTVPATVGARQPAPMPRGVPTSRPAWLSDLRVSGYGELGAAYTTAGPSHWSQLRARLEAGISGSLGAGLRFKLAGRAQGDAAYSVEDDFYPAAVRDDQRSEFTVREAYLDAGAGDWQFRLGRQHVVWGEMVGLFLADVVSARDMREFYLQEFDALRIPQWGVRAERFAGNSHFELLWIPHPSYDEIGEPGADFYPFPVPGGVPVRHDRPSRSLDNSHWGGRASHLVGGWDLSAFYYQSQDVAPTLYSGSEGLFLRNERLKQAGTTFSKDFYTWVLRGEAVHTSGRPYYTEAPGGFLPEVSESLDYVLGVSIPRGDWRWDLQLYGRHLFQHRPDMLSDADETGFTVLVNYGFGQRLEWEVLYLSGFNRRDWSLQPRLLYRLSPEWHLQLGADLFGGDPVGLFGQFDDSDRIHLELRRWF